MSHSDSNNTLNTIELDKLDLKENEELNNLLICLICQNILNNPLECSNCERGFCSFCINQLSPLKCPTCKNNSFKEPHIQTKHNLNQLNFKFPNCSCKVKYKDYFNHEKICPNNLSMCPTCQEVVYKGDSPVHGMNCPMRICNCNYCNIEIKSKDYESHLQVCCKHPETKLVIKPEKNKISKSEITIEIQSPVNNTNNTIEDTSSQNYTNTNSCYICRKDNKLKFDCIQCNLNFCINCEEIDRYGIHEYFNCLNEVLDFHIYNSFYFDHQRGTWEIYLFIFLYIIFGFICDLAIYAILTVIFVFLLGFLQFFVVLPIHYIFWNIYLGRMRKCKICAEKDRPIINGVAIE